MITALTIDGDTINPATVAADITVLHGRKKAGDGPTASSATVVVLADTMPVWALGSQITLTGDAGPVFLGQVSDRALEHWLLPDGTTRGIFTLTAMGQAAKLGYRSVGDEPWPVEPGTARAERILTLAGLPYLIDGLADALILARDVDSSPAMELLGGLADSTGAAVFDLPDGTVVYQPMRERSRPVRPFRWLDFPPEQTWADFPPDFTWADFADHHSADSEFPLDIPPAAVDWEPKWSATDADVVNHARVGYGEVSEGSVQPWTEAVDQASIDAHELRYRYFGTQLADLAGATAHVSWLLATRAQPHWAFPDVLVHLSQLDDALRAAVLQLTCGDHIRVDGMPQPAPAIVGEAIVEGWTFNQWGQDGQLFETITLHTSSLLESLAVPAWSDFPPEFTWADFDPSLTWADLTSLAAIGA